MEIKNQKNLHTLVKFILPIVIAPSLAILFLNSLSTPLELKTFFTILLAFFIIARTVKYVLDRWYWKITQKSLYGSDAKYQEVHSPIKDTRSLKEKIFSKSGFLGLVYFVWFSLMIFIYILIGLILPPFAISELGVDYQNEKIILALSWFIIFFIIRLPLNKIDKFINRKLGRSIPYEESDSIELLGTFQMNENKLLNITIFILVLFTISLMYMQFNNDKGYYYFTMEYEHNDEIGRYYSFDECIKDEAIYRKNHFYAEYNTTECEWKP